jgi:hypothetical protein
MMRLTQAQINSIQAHSTPPHSSTPSNIDFATLVFIIFSFSSNKQHIAAPVSSNEIEEKMTHLKLN